MLTKTMIALTVALVLGVASAAQAGSKDDAEHSGGYHIGPFGQYFGGPAVPRYYGRRTGFNTFAFSPGYHYRVRRHGRYRYY